MKSKCLTYTVELTREEIDTVTTALNSEYKFLKEKYDEIVEFSELGEFIESPIRNYSSGMMMRLSLIHI